jgi:hypothetical protein
MALAWALAAGTFLTGCSKAPKQPAAQATRDKAPPPAPPPAPKITQFYATVPNLARGEKELICYGVENATTVHLAPPTQELSAAISRCVEITPTQTTSYTLTVEGAGGPPATQQLTVTVGPPHVKIIDVTVSALSVPRGGLVSLCYRVENAASVEIDPIRFHGASSPKGCATDNPQKTTTYVVTANGAGGSRDQERVTVEVH